MPETLTRDMKRQALSLVRMDMDDDPWGTGMTHFFDIADTIHHVREAPPAWQYRNPWLSRVSEIIECGNDTGHNPETCRCSWPQTEYIHFLEAGELGLDMLTYAGNVLNRYLGFVKRAGLDY